MIVVKEEQGGVGVGSDPGGGGEGEEEESSGGGGREEWTRLELSGGDNEFNNNNNNNDKNSSTIMIKEESQQSSADLHNSTSANSNNHNSSNSHGHHNHHHHHHHHSGSSMSNSSSSGPGGGGGGGGNLCSGCGQRIFDRYYVLAVDRQWHNECLKCQHCGIVLSNQLTCFARDGLILCKEDYYRAYQQIPRRACARCGNGIGSQELIMRAKDLVYHLNCFVCVVCLRILNKGDHFGMRNSALYCQKHYELVLDENSGSSPPPPPGSLPPGSPSSQPPSFHHHHHHPHHPPHGHPQSSSVPPPSHTHSPLPNHHHLSNHLSLSPHHHPPPSNPTAFFNGAGSGQKGRPRKRKDLSHSNPPPLPHGLDLGATTPPGMGGHMPSSLELLGPDGNGVHLGGPRLEGYDSSSSANCGGSMGQQRTKRMRTSFKHHQLRTMKSYFAINQNPDAKDLKQLAQKTGLSKRVLQVWFQNARAKWRRNMLRSESNKSGGTTPSREDDLQINPNAMTPGALDMLSSGGGSDDGGGFSSDVY